MRGFFKMEDQPLPEKKITRRQSGSTKTTKKKEVKEPCEVCGLYKNCKSPKMKYSGRGEKEILVIAEAPGKTEDEKGIQLIGDAGKLLRTALKKFGIDLDRDCWKTNAVICRPPNNRTPSKKELNLCKPNLLKTIETLKPKFIWLMGGAAVESLYMHRFSKTLAINVWRRRLIPDFEYNSFIIPLYHPSFILRNRDEKLEKTFEDDLKWAVSCLSKSLPKPLDIDGVTVLLDAKKVIAFLKDILRTKENFYFDYETSRISPYYDDIKIWTMGANGVAFGLDHPEVNYTQKEKAEIEKLWIQILQDKEIYKTAHGLQFEDGWSRGRFKIIPEGWRRDTMITQHIVEYRPTSRALKFQSYVKWGVPDYEAETKKYIIEGSREPNKLDQMPLPDLCKYNAIDTLVGKKLEDDQDRILSRSADLEKANKLFFEGALAFCDIENEGICVNSEWYKERDKEITKICKEFENDLLTGREARKFKRVTGRDLSITSNKDLSFLFFDILKLTSTKKTNSGAPSVDVEALSEIKSPFVEDLLKYRKLLKIRDTYMAQFMREEIKGKIHPSFNLHTVDTYRSSSSAPNFQNVPVRDEEAKKETRSGIIPSPGNKLLEIDYAAMEVRICACYTKDPALIDYINDPRSDMHQDQGKELFILSEEEITKDIRFHAKNGFVFPEIYGSYYVTCARNLWEEAKHLTTKTGMPLRDHLRRKGIRSLEDFTDHVKKVETRFWKTFPLIKDWNEDNASFYMRKRYIQFLFGHRRAGYMTRNALSNYPIQGAAFHCLLWSLIRLNEIRKRNKWKTKIVGQIHDSIVFDLCPEEEENVINTAARVMTKDIRKEFDFLIVPLEVEAEITSVDGSWYDKKKVQLGGK